MNPHVFSTTPQDGVSACYTTKVAALGILDGALWGDANYTVTIQSNEKEVRAIAPTS